MKILIVSSDEETLKNLSADVRKVKPIAKVVSVANGKEAEQKAEAGFVPDVVFWDVDRVGVTEAEQWKKSNTFVNVIFYAESEEYAMEALRLHASGYVVKPHTEEDIARELDNLLYPVAEKVREDVFVRTFGDFDVFVNGVAMKFLRSKSKELLAYLVYKRGGLVSKKELAAVMFGDEYSAKTQNYLVHIYSDLVKSMKKYNVEKMLVKGQNQYGVDKTTFACDLYDLDDGKPYAVKAFKGDFMAQYEWAEV